MEKHKTDFDGPLNYAIRYKDFWTSVLIDESTGLYYVRNLFQLYGPFKTEQSGKEFRRVMQLLDSALRQKEVTSWDLSLA